MDFLSLDRLADIEEQVAEDKFYRADIEYVMKSNNSYLYKAIKNLEQLMPEGCMYPTLVLYDSFNTHGNLPSIKKDIIESVLLKQQQSQGTYSEEFAKQIQFHQGDKANFFFDLTEKYEDGYFWALTYEMIGEQLLVPKGKAVSLLVNSLQLPRN